MVITSHERPPSSYLVYFHHDVSVPLPDVEPERGVLQVQLCDAGRQVEVEQLVPQLVLCQCAVADRQRS